VRDVILLPVGTTPFHIPNGQSEPQDLGADLKLLLQDAVGDSGALRAVSTEGAADSCGKYLILEAGVSILELNIAQLGLTVGYSYSTDSNSFQLAKLDGTMDVKIGNIVMDFIVWECNGKKCTQMVNSEATHLISDVDASFKVDFTQVQVGPDLIWKTPLGGILKKIMHKGIEKLAKHPNFERLYWRASVMQNYDPLLTNLVFINAGASSGLKANQMFEVASVTPADSACTVYKTVGYGHTVRVDMDSAVLQLDQVFFDPAIIKRDDVVKIHITK
jgi:hypothetical protein